ncbi:MULTISPECIES: MFS transporter [Paraburkholderia]|uniref:MFS transporter n=1 Tax=Paraburkholderia dipogonis TaxID=1211383 RepID=A0A4Y8MH50_9BURK|nr:MULTISPECIES: MFS transporter [Paraburkholderia]RKR31291.1 hypothetical protein B0G82_7431 [Paraburkholderia sp. BL17N1]TFE36735.1 MFS transporter [Paraburkholderia dipogonis]
MSSDNQVSASSSKREIGRTLAVGLLFVAGYMSNSIYPSFVDAIANTSRLHDASIGDFATAEFLAFGVALLLAGRYLPQRKLRLTAGICLVIHLFMAYAMTKFPPGMLIICRLLYGTASGVLVSIAYIHLAQSALPGRTVAVYTTSLMVTGVVWSLVLPKVVVPLFGYSEIFLFLTFFSFVALVFLKFCPDESIVKDSTDARLIASKNNKLALSSVLILCSVGAWSFFMMIFWVYADPIAKNIPGSMAKNWLTISLVCQIFGAALSALFVEKIPAILMLSIGLCISIIQIVAILAGVDGIGFVMWTGIYGFLGYFLVAFYIKVLNKTDPINRAVILFPGVQMLTASIGPMLVSRLVSETNISGVLKIDLIAIVTSPICLWLAMVVYKRAAGRVQHIGLAGGESH